MAKTRYVQLPGGRLTSFGNRYGGDGEKRDKYSRVERARVLSRVLDREFGDMVSGMVLCTESASVWTVLEPESGKYHNRILVIEADYDTAIRVYAARNGGRHPEKVSCDCGCGADYRLTEVEGSLRIATAHARRCEVAEDYFGTAYTVEGAPRRNPSRWDYQTLEQFLSRDDVVVIRAEDITAAERAHPLPRRTYPGDYSQDAQVVAWLFDLEM